MNVTPQISESTADEKLLLLHDLIDSFRAHDPGQLLDQIVTAAQQLTAARCAGVVETDAVDGEFRQVHVHTAGRSEPPGRAVVHGPPPDSLPEPFPEFLRLLTAAAEPVRLGGDFGFLGTCLPLNTHGRAFLWVAGRPFDDRDESLLVRFAIAAGRALDASSDFVAAARMLQAVHAFTAPRR
ncbi:hypothetical protein [Bailinhaonella thermotolerans]|uniref:GAF domain-containing protein n=1 Tax=Bailinhaonella thermotolerans TaxID=1070861 RepID=A0A3A4A8Y8_9ACTN|nr:hypothetical protein [Bailinhaonella thermotolerans]RJL24479.1 hypothetical protein D5H75_29620 [Bailinhaonella thermotolerans]